MFSSNRIQSCATEMMKGSKCASYWKACSCKWQHLFYTLFAKEWNVFSIFKPLSLYINRIRFSPGWFRKYIFYPSLPGKIISYYGRYIPCARQLVTQPAASLKHPAGQTRRRIDILPKHLAKPRFLSGLLTLGLE